MSDLLGESIEPTGLAAHLMSVEPPNARRLEQLKSEIAAMYTETLTRKSRITWSLVLATSLAAVVLGVYMVTHVDVPQAYGSTRLLRGVWGLFTLGNVLGVWGAARVLTRGAVNVRNRPRTALMVLWITLGIAVLLVVQAVTHPTIPMLAWAVYGVIWVVVATGQRVMTKLGQSDLATREALLRLELRLAEMERR